jgi:DNA-binding Lrp family transcriptional regulator
MLKVLLVNNGIPPGSPILRKSLRSIAKDLGVDQHTVRIRMKKFQEQGILKGWYLGVSPGLRAQNVVHAWFMVDPGSSKRDVIDRLLPVPDVERMCDYLGQKLSIVLFCERETDPDICLSRLGTLAGSNVVLHKQGVVPVPIRNVTRTDAAIIGILRRDPSKPYPAIAKELGLSAKTVKRRITMLSEDGAVYMLPVIDLKALHGIIPVELVVEYVSPELRRGADEQIVSNIRDGLVFSDTSGPHGYFALIVSNIARVEQVASLVKQLNGVRGAHTEVLQDVILNRTHYEHWRVDVGRGPPGLGARPEIQ